LPALRESKAGAIVNLSSGAATMAVGTIAQYAAAKAALNSYSRALAIDLAPSKIRVNVVSPGPVTTPGSREFTDALGAPPEAFAKDIPMGRVRAPGWLVELHPTDMRCLQARRTRSYSPHRKVSTRIGGRWIHGVRRREVRRDCRTARPVEQHCWQTVMLRKSHQGESRTRRVGGRRQEAGVSVRVYLRRFRRYQYARSTKSERELVVESVLQVHATAPGGPITINRDGTEPVSAAAS
jgi:hypothetical protein